LNFSLKTFELFAIIDSFGESHGLRHVFGYFPMALRRRIPVN